METERLSAGSIIAYGKLWQGPAGDAPAKRLASTAVAGGSAMLGPESGQRRRRPFWACEEAFRSEHWFGKLRYEIGYVTDPYAGTINFQICNRTLS